MNYVTKNLRSHVLAFLVASLLAIVRIAFVAQSTTLAAASTATLTVHVEDVQMGKANAVQVTSIGGTLLDTCQASTTSSHSTTCTFQVPVETGFLIVAQPAPGEALKAFSDNTCGSAPGPVCHLMVYTANKQVIAQFERAIPGPTAIAVSPFVDGDSPVCTFGNDTVTVNGGGFQQNSAATLSDDGNTVSSGMTDSNGLVSLNYTAKSEPGIYRTLVVNVAGKTAHTDIYNSAVFCWTSYNTNGSGSIQFIKIAANDLDANKVENYIQFAGNPKLALTFTETGTAGASAGYASLSSLPKYACPPNTTQTLQIFFDRGRGTPAHYTYTANAPIPC